MRLDEQSDIAFFAAVQALTLKSFYIYGADSCRELNLKSLSFNARAPDLNDSVSAEAIRVRHASWAKALSTEPVAFWDRGRKMTAIADLQISRR
ncbi:hypothetical protein [Xanthobacter sp. ZOL 2024]